MPAEGETVVDESCGAGRAGISADGGRQRSHAGSCEKLLAKSGFKTLARAGKPPVAPKKRGLEANISEVGTHGSLALPTRVLRPNKALLEGLLTPG
jgi:hypothetical protein